MFEVHLDTLDDWSKRNWYAKDSSRTLLERIRAAEKEYDQVIPFEEDPWEPIWNPSECKFSYVQIASVLGDRNLVDLVGVQRSICVGEVYRQLKKFGVNVNLRDDLVADLDKWEGVLV